LNEVVSAPVLVLTLLSANRIVRLAASADVAVSSDPGDHRDTAGYETLHYFDSLP